MLFRSNEIVKKLSYFISFWYTAGLEVTEDDFKSAEENYNSSVTKYLVEEAVNEPPAETPKA